MAKKRVTKKGLRRKDTFGGANIDHFSPPVNDDTPKSQNFVLSFEEALKLHLSLGQALAHLNGYDRSTTAGRRTAVNICLHTRSERIVVTEYKIKK